MKKCDFWFIFKWKMWFFVLILNEKMWFLDQFWMKNVDLYIGFLRHFFVKFVFFCKCLINFPKTPIIHDQKKWLFFVNFLVFFEFFEFFVIFVNFLVLKSYIQIDFFEQKVIKLWFFWFLCDFFWFYLILWCQKCDIFLWNLYFFTFLVILGA